VPDHASVIAPGRVNLIGEHTDYNRGLALPFTIADGVTVHGTTLSGNAIEAVALELDERDRFELQRIGPATGWRAYVRGTVAELLRAGVPVAAARLEISGTVPRGGGLSSSAALEVALSLMLLALAGTPTEDRLALAELCSRVEHDWVGARSGLLDQIAVLFGSSGHATLIDFSSMEVTAIPLDLAGHQLLTVDSGQTRSNAESGYNQRRDECERACVALGLPSLREATLAQANALSEPLASRARHVVTENARVLAAVAALGRHDLGSLADLLNASHASLRDDYEVSCAAVEQVRDGLLAGGALGARLIGGGFGGHVLGLFPPGAQLPDRARPVVPGPGPRQLTRSGGAV
jgi:galactokinase